MAVRRHGRGVVEVLPHVFSIAQANIARGSTTLWRLSKRRKEKARIKARGRPCVALAGCLFIWRGKTAPARCAHVDLAGFIKAPSRVTLAKGCRIRGFACIFLGLEARAHIRRDVKLGGLHD